MFRLICASTSKYVHLQVGASTSKYMHTADFIIEMAICYRN